MPPRPSSPRSRSPRARKLGTKTPGLASRLRRDKIVKSNLPPPLQKRIEELIEARKPRDAALGYAPMLAVGGYFNAEIPGLREVMVAGSGYAIASAHHSNKRVKKTTEELGKALLTSRDSEIQRLRSKYKYLYVSWRGSVIGTNRKPVFGKMGRKRIGTGKE